MCHLLSRGVLALGAALLAGVLLARSGSAAPAADTPSPNPPHRLSDRAADMVDRIRNKVIVVRTAHSDHHGFATGFLAAPGMVLTSAHAVSGLTTAVIWINGVAYSATVAAVHPDLDVALLRLRAPELLLKPVTLAESTRNLEPDEELVAVPGPAQPASTNTEPASRRARPLRFGSQITQRNAQGRPGPVLLLKGSTERGDSGSPVLRARDGVVVGIVVGRELEDADGMSHAAYAVPVDAFQAWLASYAREAAQTSADAPPPDDFYLSRLGKRER
jgi:S1-C subfamily serine protease